MAAGGANTAGDGPQVLAYCGAPLEGRGEGRGEGQWQNHRLGHQLGSTLKSLSMSSCVGWLAEMGKGTQCGW